MKSIRGVTFIKLALLAALAIGFSTGPANAQQYRAQVTLPFQTRWGAANMPAGNYSFTVVRMQSGAVIVLLYRGDKGVAIIPSAGSLTPWSGRNELTIARSGARNTVTELSLPQFGVLVYYRPPKPKHETAPREKVLAQNIPVAAVPK
jgi:hypothetical protein